MKLLLVMTLCLVSFGASAYYGETQDQQLNNLRSEIDEMKKEKKREDFNRDMEARGNSWRQYR